MLFRSFDADLARAIGQALGREVRLRVAKYNYAQKMVLSGEADAVSDLGLASASRDRFDFTDVVLVHEFGLFVRGGSGVASLSDLSGRRVGGVTGSILTFLRAQSDVRVVQAENYPSAFEQLTKGDVDAVAADTWNAADQLSDRSRGIELVGTPFFAASTAYGVRKGNDAVRDDSIARSGCSKRTARSSACGHGGSRGSRVSRATCW